MTVGTELCFVYGTLLSGFGNHHIMRQAGGELRGQAISVTPFPLVVTDLPYLLDDPGKGFRVEGEIYWIPPTGWEAIDRLEGHPDFYRRRIERFELGDEIVDAWVYFIARDAPGLRGMSPVRRFDDRGDAKKIT